MEARIWMTGPEGESRQRRCRRGAPLRLAAGAGAVWKSRSAAAPSGWPTAAPGRWPASTPRPSWLPAATTAPSPASNP